MKQKSGETLKNSMMAILLLMALRQPASVMDEVFDQGVGRSTASTNKNFCITNSSGRVFGASCFTTYELCEKRLSFWRDLPGDAPTNCEQMR
jgi:hypothetical protein